MSYTPTQWNTGDTITASALNKIENGIANAGGSPWDAIIRLVHTNDSGPDTSANLTISIVSGTYASLMAKINDGGFPCILVEYQHPYGIRFSDIMGYVNYVGGNALTFAIAGFSFMGGDQFKLFGYAVWDDGDNLYWN